MLLAAPFNLPPSSMPTSAAIQSFLPRRVERGRLHFFSLSPSRSISTVSDLLAIGPSLDRFSSLLRRAIDTVSYHSISGFNLISSFNENPLKMFPRI
jgi:hypothetical protein